MKSNKSGEKIEDTNLECSHKKLRYIDNMKRKLNPKLIAIIVLIVIIIVVLISFIISKRLNQLKKIQGNTVGNISNEGIAAIEDDWIYYESNNSDNKNSSIYREKADGSEKSEIKTDLNGYPYLNVVNNWVYYINRNPDDLKYSICKMKIDGSKKTEIENNLDSIRDLNVIGSWIYYSKFDSDSKKYSICKMKIDGSQKKEIETEIESVQDLNVAGDWIYYYNDEISDNHATIYKIKTDGTNKTEVYQIKANKDEIELAKIKSNKSELEKSIEVNMITSLDVVDEWIYCQYYNSQNHKYKIIKIKTDGSQEVDLTKESERFNTINIQGEWVYGISYDIAKESIVYIR